MSGRAPRWKKLGFQSESEYRAACSAKRKSERAALAATKAENSALQILKQMWSNADFHSPRVVVTKEQLMSSCRCSLKTVKRSLADLRSEGSIKPVKNWEGGRGVPTTYRLCVSGVDGTPSEAHLEQIEAKRDREAAFQFLKGKYGGLKALELMGDPDDE